MIRKATREDAASIHEVHTASIRELCAGAYTPAQISAWTARLSPERYVKGMEGLEFYVAEGGEGGQGRLSGMLAFDKESGEIYALYVAPWAANKGVGTSLMALAETVLGEEGHAEMRLKSTLNAVPFYESRGFERAGESIHELGGGETLPCMAMVKKLGGKAEGRP